MREQIVQETRVVSHQQIRAGHDLGHEVESAKRAVRKAIVNYGLWQSEGCQVEVTIRVSAKART